MSERLHSPFTVRGKAGRGAMPKLIKITGQKRRTPKRRHPLCTTDKHPHRAVVRDWMRQGFTLEAAADFVRTRFPDGDTLMERALTVYGKMGIVVPKPDTTTRFPLAYSDLGEIKGSSILENLGFDEDERKERAQSARDAMLTKMENGL